MSTNEVNPNDLEPNELINTLREFVKDHEGEEWSDTEIYNELGWTYEEKDHHDAHREQFFGVISAMDVLWYTDSGVNPLARDEGRWEFKAED